MVTRQCTHPWVEEPQSFNTIYHEDFSPPLVCNVPSYKVPQQPQQPAYNNRMQFHRCLNTHYDRSPTPSLGRREINVKIPTFHDLYDAWFFLNWVTKCNSALRHCHYEEHVDLVTLHFSDATLSWWYGLVTYRNRYNLEAIMTWNQLVWGWRVIMSLRITKIKWDQRYA